MEEMPRIFGRTEKKEPAVKADRAIYNGVLFSRAFDPYSDEPYPHKSEEWAVQILCYVLLSEYPPMPPTEQMKWQLLLSKEAVKDDANKVRLIGCDAADKPEATWKEIVILKQRKMLLAFNLISHGRRVFKQLVYTTDSQFSLHNLPLKSKGIFQFAAGDFKKKRSHDDSLVIVRKNTELSGNEVFIPSRLLHGVVPSALLEAFHIWQGEDELLRGTPIEEGSQWFNFKLEISLSKRDPLIKGEENVVATIVRRPFHIPATKIKSQSSGVSQSALLQESGMRIQL